MPATKRAPTHPINKLIEEALIALKQVQSALRSGEVDSLTNRDSRKLNKLIEEAVKTRDLAIIRARKAGYSVALIAETFSISGARVSQITRKPR